MIRQILKKSLMNYETRMAPWIARYARWIYWPIYRICQAFNISFVINIAGGTGHIICELDYFFRRLYLKEIDPSKRYVWLRKADPTSLAMIQLYHYQFWLAQCSYILYELFLPLTIAFPEITLDCGLSRLKWQLNSKGEYFRPLPGQTYLNQISKKEGFDQWQRYFTLRNLSPDYFPLCQGRFEMNDLRNFIQNDSHPIALVHIKFDQRNATASPSDPKTYIPALQALLDRGYSLIFVGREKMPIEFQSFPIFNYSESQWANFKNDIQLFYAADLMILSGSGIAYLADCLGKPYLYLNSWHLSQAPFSSKCIRVPTLVKNKSDNKYLKFKDQMELYHSLPDHGAEIFPDEHYLARNASGDEILAALEELLVLDQQSPSFLQNQYQHLEPASLLLVSQSHCSEYFLKNHAGLF